MPVSPQDFALWASATGRKYPQTAGERAQLTPEVFNFVRNLPKTGLPGGAGEVVERVVYDHPVAVRHEDDNSVFNAPINPDNHVPKVAGTVGNTMTSDHYEAQLAENQEDKADSTNFARTAAKLALAAGVVAGGVAAARSPVVRSRVSEFLSQFGTPREGVVDMVAASGDITPQTTAQNYNQEVIAPQTQIQQAARGAAPGTALKALDPTTTESVRVKPVTESEVIAATQNFAPSGSLTADPWTGQKTIPTVSERTSDFLTEFGQTGTQDPWTTRQGTSYTPIFPVSPEYKKQYPPKSSLEETGGFTGQVTAATSPGRFVLHEEVPRPTLGGKSLVRTMGEGPVSETVTVEVPLSPYPEQRNVTGARLGGVTRLAGARDIEAAISTYAGQGVFPSGQYSSLATGLEYMPVSPGDRPASPIEPKIIGGTEQSILDKTKEYLGGKATWMEKSEKTREAEQQERVGRAIQSLSTLKQQAAAMPDEGARKKAETFINQVTNLYDVTQDPSVLEAATQQAMPLAITFPGGQTVETKQFFKPFGTTGGKPSTDPQYAKQRVVTSPVEALEGVVIGKQTTYNNIKANILGQFGLSPTDKITNNMFNQLPDQQRQLLVNASEELKDATARYNRAKDFQVLYSIPEQVASVKEVPVISQQSGDVVGAVVVPEERAIATPELHRIFAAGGAGRQETGGVGRRRETLQSDPGGSEMVFSTGSELESTPFLYRHVDTGEILNPNAVTEDMVKNRVVKAIRGTSVEPQRIMGQEGRTFKGVSSAEIDPRSFDEVQRQLLAQQYPERVSPEGLIYSERAMQRPTETNYPSRTSRLTSAQRKAKINSLIASTEAAKSVGIPMNTPEQFSNVQSNVRTGTASPAQQAFQRAILSGLAAGGEPGSFPFAKLTSTAPSQTVALEQPSATVVTQREFTPTQLVIPGAGITPVIRSTPALEEAIATEQYMGTRPGQKMRTALQKALSRATTSQPSLF